MRVTSEYTIGVALLSYLLTIVLEPAWLLSVQERLADPLWEDPTCVAMGVDYPDYPRRLIQSNCLPATFNRPEGCGMVPDRWRWAVLFRGGGLDNS